MLTLKWKQILPCCALLMASSALDAAEPPTIAVDYAIDLGGQLTGRVSGADPDGSPITLEFVSAYLHALYSITIANDPPYSTAEWIPTGSGYIFGSELAFDAAGVIQGQQYFYFAEDNPYGGIHTEYGVDAYYANVRVRDSEDLVSQTVGILLGPAFGTAIYTGTLFLPPVVLDLDGDGVETVAFRNSSVAFQTSKGGVPSITGWIAPDDALLALDRNRDGMINDGSEISFINDFKGSKSDLSGLRAFDSNGNGLLDLQDERYREFLVWRDANQDGKSQPDELRPLLAYEIRSIELTPIPTSNMPTDLLDNLITGTAEFTRTDGTKGIVGDVSLAYLGKPSAQPTLASTVGGILAKDSD